MTTNIHPFPARMAPDLALNSLKDLPHRGVILDPMAGSGMVLRQANDLGFKAVGFDMDPLAVLMTRVWTRMVPDEKIASIYKKCLRIALEINSEDISLPWIDDDQETAKFITYWFGKKQIRDLRCWAYAFEFLGNQLTSEDEKAALDVIKIGLSRIIITKEQCASLARDTSHSRPHRVTTESDYSVFEGIDRSVNTVRKRLINHPPKGGSIVQIGDARSISLPDHSIDGVLTSPPYLNAIDYMRGHRMSLVWLGHKLGELRNVRSDAIGAERGPDEALTCSEMRKAFGKVDELPKRYIAMIDRYAGDIMKTISEIKRVLVPGGTATFVVGNSCLKGVFIINADAVATAAEMSGFSLSHQYERDLPTNSRYLPTSAGSPLHKRMRTETILTVTA